MKKASLKINLLKFLITGLMLPVFGILQAQQQPDTSFTWQNPEPSYEKGAGPLVRIDEAHENFHTKEGGFYAFAKLLERDGYRVGKLQHMVDSPAVLQGCDILVIANARQPSDSNGSAANSKSAFSETEIRTLTKWVEEGGSLLLIADHMPFAGAAQKLAAAFGFEFLNGFAFTQEDGWPPSLFTLADGTLKSSPVSDGNGYSIDTVATFTGSAFTIPDDAIPLLAFDETHFSLQPDTAWRFHSNTPSVNLGGYYQGAILEFGKGKLAVFGEAAMFTAQIVNENFPVGFNSPVAPQNAAFVLCLMGWLEQQ